MRTALVWDDSLARYRFGPDHPLNPRRLELTLSLIHRLGLAGGEDAPIVSPRVATEDELLLAHAPEYIVAVKRAQSASLAASDDYARTFDLAGTRAGAEVYVDVGALVALLADGIELPDDARDILLQVGSFGLTAPSRPDQIEFHAVLTVDEP